MIIDSISNCDKYASLHKDFEKVFSFLKNLKSDVQEGKKVLDENNVWANVINVKNVANGPKVIEAHKAFLDIHYILFGEVKVGYANIDHLKEKQSYNEADDYLLLEGEANAILLKEGDFMITYPEDAHIPDLKKENDDKLVRVVVKVRM